MPDAPATTSIEHRAMTVTVRTPQCGHTVWGTIWQRSRTCLSAYRMSSNSARVAGTILLNSITCFARTISWHLCHLIFFHFFSREFLPISSHLVSSRFSSSVRIFSHFFFSSSQFLSVHLVSVLLTSSQIISLVSAHLGSSQLISPHIGSFQFFWVYVSSSQFVSVLLFFSVFLNFSQLMSARLSSSQLFSNKVYMHFCSKPASWSCKNEIFAQDLLQILQVADMKTTLSCETAFKHSKVKLWKRSFRADFLQNLQLQIVKTTF